MDGGAGGDDRQRQRQPGAAIDDVVRRLDLGGDPVGAQPESQQPPGLLRRQQPQGDRMRAIGHDQPGQLIAARDDGQAAGCPGQQRDDLVGVAGVVHQDQHPPPGQQAAVQSRLRGRTLRDSLRWNL
ncbi:hypothetical protein LUX57_23760 [Actinomadura madurae]|nr:hypothetical protein [Actinomadura madurae]MCP9967780.1 hypothetical protein [Actinomadura madurae]MCQ0008246.1 hypothetical protein [Actinomadura madurae]